MKGKHKSTQTSLQIELRVAETGLVGPRIGENIAPSNLISSIPTIVNEVANSIYSEVCMEGKNRLLRINVKCAKT